MKATTGALARLPRNEAGIPLARFRADPFRVRVGVRRLDDGRWCVTITPRGPGVEVGTVHRRLKAALWRALCLAEWREMPGIDRAMGWSYQHPQHPGARSLR